MQWQSCPPGERLLLGVEPTLVAADACARTTCESATGFAQPVNRWSLVVGGLVAAGAQRPPDRTAEALPQRQLAVLSTLRVRAQRWSTTLTIRWISG